MGTDPDHQPVDQPNSSEVEDGVGPPADSSQDESRSLLDPFKDTASFVDPEKSRSFAGKVSSQVPATLGRFKINGVLGSGGFGTVYLGFDDRLKRNVAIKVPTRVLSSLEMDKFLEEAQRLAQLRHAGIVTVFDVGEFDGRCYIVSDYLDGMSLADWMNRETYDWPTAALITAKLADALAHAHAQGTVHRDIKPSNVMMLADDEPVLIDFGLAISDTHGERETPGTISGTLTYMSPEQATGKAHRIDGRTDIYGLGVVLYRLLCRKHPFASKDTIELLRQICEDEPQPPRQINPDIPVELERVCLKAMSKRTGDRYTTALDLAEALREVVKQVGGDKEASSKIDPTPAVQAEDSAPRSSTRMHEAERRQITTLYLELDDSEIDVDDMDPEEMRNVVQRIRDLTNRVLTKYGGHFAHTTSEAIQVYFGYPHAREDSARQAVLAGLDLSTELQQMQEQSKKSDELMVDFSIGVHTGIVVTEEVKSDVSSERHSIVGNVPRVAAGLAALAEPNSVVISGPTRQIVGHDFTFESLGTHSSKAIGRNVELFAVQGLSGNLGETTEYDTPLIGREHETGMLNQRWDEARNVSGQVVLVCAEAGVGKSRLLSAFRQSLSDSSLQSFEARCSTYHQNSTLHPISELLKSLAELSSDDSDEAKLEKLEAMLDRYDIPLEDAVPLFVDLFSIPLGPRYAVFDGSPQLRKQRTIETLVELMLAASESRPLLFTIEDLHWADPTTLEFLTVLIEQIPSAPILLVVTYRPEFTSPWAMHAGLTQLMIGNLTPQQTAVVATKIADDRTLPPEVVDHIVEKTGGVPLFTEELTKVILESDILEESGEGFVLARPLASVTIPSTLQDSLMARLDKLGPSKEVAQLAAVVGREFSFKLLAALAPLDEETLKTDLTRLVDAELIHQRGFYPRARFTFKHALVQDTAYASLLRATRQQWHGKIGDVLVEQFPKIAEAEPALLAHHYTEAGQAIPAIGYWEKAGLQAQERFANHEAVSHFEQGRALIEKLDASDERDSLEFKFQVPYGVALLSTRGYAAPEVGPVFERARALGKKLAGPAEQFFIHWGIWAWRVVREELQLCSYLADEALELVEPLGDDGLTIEALFIPALTSFYLGDFETSLKHCEQGFALYEAETAKACARHTGQNVGVTMQCYWALSLWHLGYPEQAIERIGKTVELARSVKHPFSLGYALCHCGWFYHNCRLSEEVRRVADEGAKLLEFPFWQAECTFHQGFSQLLDGQPEAALELLQKGLSIFSMTGAKLSLCQFYAMFAEAHRQQGDTDEAMRRIDESLLASGTNGNVFFLAEIHRIRGEILLADGREEDAETCFNQSLEIARQQQAKSWELRTTMSLCRLRQSQGRGKEAHAALASVYSWFTEGFDAPDLVDANQLLDELQ